MYNILTVGSGCSPAAALKNLNLREIALPFDWIVSNIFNIEECFEDNFARFHNNLKFNHNKTRLIDDYGFEFPHDYPLVDTCNNSIDTIGEGVIGEEPGKYITDDWIKYYDIVKQKYNRRIQRFLNIVNSPEPIIVLCRWKTNHVLYLEQLFLKYYNKKNIIFVNSCPEIFANTTIINCYTEKNNIWNDVAVWKETVDYAINNMLRLQYTK